jgi:hypothetical protein
MGRFTLLKPGEQAVTLLKEHLYVNYVDILAGGPQ